MAFHLHPCLLHSWGKAGGTGDDTCMENSYQVGKVFWKSNQTVRGS